MSIFDWGVFKSGGDEILACSSLLYLSALVIATICVLHIRRRKKRPRLAICLAVFALLPMLLMSFASISLQLTSAHYQETTHIPAVVVISVAFAATVLARYVVRVSAKQTSTTAPRDANIDKERTVQNRQETQNPYQSPRG